MNCFENGRLILKDRTLSYWLELFESALKCTQDGLGKALLYLRIAEIHYTGFESRTLLHSGYTIRAPDFKKAKDYFKKASEQNDCLWAQGKAFIYLAKMAYKGQGEVKNNSAALEFYKMALRHGFKSINNEAYIGMGKIYYEEKKYHKALKYFEKCAHEDGDQEAQAIAWCYLGQLYEQGHGVEEDASRASEYFYKVEDQTASEWDHTGMALFWTKSSKISSVRSSGVVL